jgi:hypothetical protein
MGRRLSATKTTMRQHLSIYLPEEMYARVKREAWEQGVSLSAYVTARLLLDPEELQTWFEARFQQLEALIKQNPCGGTDDGSTSHN